MTNDERREAERLSKRHCHSEVSPSVAYESGFVDAYAAEANRAESESEERWADQYFKELEAEHARSAKLIEMLKGAERALIRDNLCGLEKLISAAIAEYEASK